MKKRVLHVINTFLPGGAETLLCNSLSPGGLNDYTENHLAFFMAPSYLLDKLDKNVKVHFINYKGGIHVLNLIKQLKQIILENKIDIVHTHLNPAGLYTHFACPKNVPHVHTMHTTYSMDMETPWLKLWGEKLFYFMRKNVNIIFLSSFTKNDFLNAVKFNGKAYVLNNFVPDNFFKSAKEYTTAGVSLKLIAVGRLNPVKNLVYLLEVFSYLKDINVQLDIYGRGDLNAFDKLIASQQLKVTMKGHENDISEVLPSYDLLIMPSKYEGYPLAAFEAMASGLPVMVSNTVPFNNLLKDNALYFSLDDAQGTANIIRDIFHGKIDISEITIRSHLFANETARKELYIKKLISIYNEIK